MPAHLAVAGTNPVGHAIGRERVTIPVEETARRRARQVHQTPVAHSAQTAVAALALGHPALAAAQNTGQAPGAPRRNHRQAERPPCLLVDSLRNATGLMGTSAGALAAQPQRFADQRRAAPTEQALLLAWG